MEALNFVISFLGALAANSVVAKVLVVVISVATGLAGLANAFVALWHGLVLFFIALSVLPYVGKYFASAAKFFQVSESAIDDFSAGKLVPVLNRLSAIPLPQKLDVPGVK